MPLDPAGQMARRLRKLKVREFINNVLIGEFKDIQQRHPYVSFSLIGLGIELLGACIGEFEFAEKWKSAERFRNAIKELFPQEYQVYNDENRGDDLYDNLRCGFAHQSRPGGKIALTHRAESERENTEHLKDYKGKLILVAENLFEDFEAACRGVIRRIDDGEITYKKLQDEFLITRF